MANEVVNKDDLHDVRDVLSEQIQHGFSGVTARLDVLNGRVGKGEVVAGEHRVRLENIEQQLRDRKSTTTTTTTTEQNDGQAAFTKRDLKVAVAVMTAGSVLAQLLFKVVPWLAKVAQP